MRNVPTAGHACIDVGQQLRRDGELQAQGARPSAPRLARLSSGARQAEVLWQQQLQQGRGEAAAGEMCDSEKAGGDQEAACR